MRTTKNLVAVLTVVFTILLGFPTVSAYPILENGHDSYDPPPYIPPSGPPPSGPPSLPPSGYFTVDCPAGGWLVDYINAYDPYACVHRNGPATWAYSGRINYSYVARGWFPDTYQPYNWPVQVMPLANGTILSVYLIVVAKMSSTDFYPPYPNISLQYSIDGQQTYYPNSPGVNDTFSVSNVAAFQEYQFNVTTWVNWTPEILLSPNMFVKVNITGAVSLSPMLIDYLGLRYNWTYGASPGETKGPYDFELNVTSMQFAKGIIGAAGFVLLVASPALGIMIARQSGSPKFKIAIITLAMMITAYTLLMYSLGL